MIEITKDNLISVFIITDPLDKILQRKNKQNLKRYSFIEKTGIKI
jgi:hypothetical protein